MSGASSGASPSRAPGVDLAVAVRGLLRRMGTDFATGHEVFRVLDVRDEAIKVRGVPQHTAKLVTINFHEPGKQNGLTYHMHAVSVGGRWTWILGGRFLSALSHGQCLDGSPLRATA